MKNGKAPTRKQRMAMKAVGLNCENWLIYKRIDGMLYIVHRNTGSKRKIPESWE